MKDFAEAALQDMLNDFYDACTRCMFTVERVDEDRVSQAIIDLYGAMNLSAPEIVFLESAWQLDKADSYIRKKRMYMNQFVWRQLQMVQSTIVSAIGPDTLAFCRDFLSSGHTSQTSLPGDRTQGLARITQHLKSVMMAPMTRAETSTLFDRLASVMRVKFRADDGTPLYKRLPQHDEQIYYEWPPFVDFYVFAWDLIDMTAATRFAVEYLGIELSKSEHDALRPVLDLAAHGHAFRFTEELVLCSERPEILSVDSNDRLHALITPALQYKDGMSRYAWHGVTVPEYAVAQQVHISRIQREENAEVLQVMIERYGEERFLKEIGARITNRSEFGTLYWYFLEGSRTVHAMLAVKNSTPESDGRFKTYYLQVPPELNSAKAAVAWTFGMEEEEYEPVVQT